MHNLATCRLPADLSAYSQIIDARSPAEFAIDHIPGAINLPVLSDDERIKVGTLYKESPFEARKLGAALISANVSRYLLEHFHDKELDYTPLIYCWRGGMRSRSFTHILSSIGWKAQVLSGGYRAFRKFVVDDLTATLEVPTLKLSILSGLTGVGKTRLLHALAAEGQQVLDLEGLANHKGSWLGSPQDGQQPSQKQFETRLWDTLKAFDPSKPIWTEAESNRIGKVHCPQALWQKLRAGDVYHIELSIDQRIKLLSEDYPHFSEQPDALIELLNVLKKIRGNKQVEQWQEQISTRDWQAFLTSILVDHYDLSYRRSGDGESIYAAPIHSLTVDSAHTSDYRIAALSLIKTIQS